MTSPDRGLIRVVRAGVVAACVVTLSLVAHVWAGGDVPGPVVLLGSAAAIAAYAGVLTRERLSAVELIGVLSAGQVLLHMAFMTSGGTHAGGPAMLAGHAIAAVVLALGLARGEEAAWSLWGWLRPRFVIPDAEAGAPDERVDYLAATASARVQLTWIGTSVWWRGPPPPSSHPD